MLHFVLSRVGTLLSKGTGGCRGEVGLTTASVGQGGDNIVQAG